MKSLQLIVVFIIILSVAFLSQSNDFFSGKHKRTVTKESVLQEKDMNITRSPTAYEESNIKVQPDPSDSMSERRDDDTPDYYYPKAKVISESSTAVKLSSSDNPNDITQWYEAYIRSNAMTTKTFVKTRTNGLVKNTLTGVSVAREITIEIKKDSDNYTTVTIRAKSY